MPNNIEYTEKSPKEETLPLSIDYGKQAKHAGDLKDMVMHKIRMELAKQSVILVAFIAIISAGWRGNVLSDNRQAWLDMFYPIALLILAFCPVSVVHEGVHNMTTVARGMKHCLARDFGEYNTPESEAEFRTLLHRYYVDANHKHYGTYAGLYSILLLITYAPSNITINRTYACSDVDISFRSPVGGTLQFLVPEEVLMRLFKKKDMRYVTSENRQVTRTELVLE